MKTLARTLVLILLVIAAVVVLAFGAYVLHLTGGVGLSQSNPIYEMNGMLLVCCVGVLLYVAGSKVL